MDAVLNTPELLGLILCSFPTPVKPSILLNCALVSKDWNWTALEILWGRKGYVEHSNLAFKEASILGDMVASLITSGSPDFSRPLKYASFLTSISLDQADCGFGCDDFLPLLSFPGTFRRLRYLGLCEDASDHHKSAQCLTIMLHLITPQLRTIVAQSKRPINYKGNLRTLLRQSGILTSLEHLKVGFLDADADWLSSEIMSNIGRFRKLKQLELDPIIMTCELFHMLASNLLHLEVLHLFAKAYNTEAYHRNKPPVMQFGGADLLRFPSLKDLQLYNAPENIREILRLISSSGNALQDVYLGTAARISNSNSGIFPENFAAMALNSLEVYLDLDSTTSHNLAGGMGNLVNLQTLIIGGDNLIQITNEELAAALQPCHSLEIISLNLSPRGLLVANAGSDRLTVRCLGALLSSHPYLRQVKGSFDLDLSNVPWDIVPHPKLERIDLGMSYFFSTQAWGDWVPDTAGYLCAFFKGKCDIALSDDMCMLDIATIDQHVALCKQRRGDIETLRSCVRTVNISRRAPLN